MRPPFLEDRRPKELFFRNFSSFGEEEVASLNILCTFGDLMFRGCFV